MKSKKILLVVESIDVEDSSGSKANVALIQNLHKIGYELRIYHYTRKVIQLPGIDCIAIPERKWNLLFLLSRMERQFRNKLKLDLHKPLERIFGFSFTLFNDRNSIIRALKGMRDFEPDLVITLSKGGSFRPHHALIKLPKFHSRWMAYVHDPYPMHAYPRPYDWVEPGHQKKRRFFLKVAEKATFAAYPSKLLGDWMESYYPQLKGKAVIVPHQISVKDVEVKVLPSFFKQDCFTIVHAGALMSARNPLPLVEAYRKFLERIPEATNESQLLFLGDAFSYSGIFSKLKKEIPQFYSSNGYISFDTVQAIQKAATVNVILEAKGPLSPFLPGKFPHCIMAGKQILLLGPLYSESRRLLGKSFRYWSEIDDEGRIYNHLLEMYDLWKRDPSFLRFNYSVLEDYLSVKNLEKVFRNLSR